MKSIYNPASQEKSTDLKIAFAIDKLSESLRNLIWTKYSKYKLSPIQIKFLIYLLYQSGSGRTVSNLAREFDLTKATVSDAIRSLENKSLLVRKKGKEDRRISRLTLTAKGTQTARSLSDFGSELLSSIKRIEKGKKTVLMRSLMDIIEGMHRQGIISVARICTTCGHFESAKASKGRYKCKRVGKSMSEDDLKMNCRSHKVRSDSP